MSLILLIASLSFKNVELLLILEKGPLNETLKNFNRTINFMRSRDLRKSFYKIKKLTGGFILTMRNQVYKTEIYEVTQQKLFKNSIRCKYSFPITR